MLIHYTNGFIYIMANDGFAAFHPGQFLVLSFPGCEEQPLSARALWISRVPPNIARGSLSNWQFLHLMKVTSDTNLLSQCKEEGVLPSDHCGKKG